MLAGATVIEVRDLGLVAPLVVAVAQVRQQAGAANGAVLQARIALLDGAQVDRVIAQGLLVEFEGPHGPGVVAHGNGQHGQPIETLHSAGHPYSSVNAEPARSSSGLNR
ncbi:hypothetical protein D3C76_1418150 [compost metagenome]